ncbi:MAG: substrate-binding domain-containing protein [Deltaproteobacteria bacterium]|nr:substrate-binding domain-containing protein [Deltaproteobacteria bacterium]
MRLSIPATSPQVPRLNRQPQKRVAISALFLVFAALGACTKKTEPAPNATGAPGTGAGTYRFAFVTNNSSDFWNIAEKGLRKAEKDFAVKVDMFRPLKGEIADQQRFLEDIMVQSFDGVAISPINPDAMTGTFDKVAAKMPLVCHDSDAPKSKRNVYVGTNNVQAGRAAGAAAIEALKAAKITKGKIAIFVGRIDMQNAIERKQGVDETLGKLPGFEILPVYLDKTDRALAKKNVEDALARYPDLALLMGLWSYNGPCMAGAVRSSSRTEKPVMIAFDEEEETLKAVQDSAIFATIVQRPFQFGYQSIKALKDLKDGKTVPAVVDTGILTVKKENVAQFWSELRELKK